MVPESTRRGFLAAAATGALAGCGLLPGGSADDPTETPASEQSRWCAPVDAAWPTAGGDTRRSGHAPDLELPSLDADTAQFSYPANGTPGQPVVGPDHVFLPHPGGVRAFTRDPVEEAWTAEDTDAAVVTVGCDSCFARSRSRLAALDPATGAVRWEENVNADVRGRSLAVVGSTLYAGSKAFDATTGDVVFDGDVTPQNAVGRHLYVAGERVTALDRRTGTELWMADEDWDDVPRIAVGSNVVAVTAGVDHVTGLDAQTGDRLWRSDSLAEVFAAPAVTDDAVVVSSGTGQLARCFDAASGEQQWRAEIGQCLAAPVVVGDTVVFASKDERWPAVSLADGEVRGRFDAAGNRYTPAVADGRFFHRGGYGHFYVTG